MRCSGRARLLKAFLPLLITADKFNEKEIILEVAPLVEHIGGASLGVGDVITCITFIDQRKVRKINLQPTTLAEFLARSLCLLSREYDCCCSSS